VPDFIKIPPKVKKELRRQSILHKMQKLTPRAITPLKMGVKRYTL
jgi:hypothetical protein